MKTKIWIMVGVLIIAFATMAVPVMADLPGDQSGGASGTQEQNASISWNNGNFDFGNFVIGDNINSTPQLIVYSNEAAWSVYLYSNPNPMQTSSGPTYTLANKMQVKNNAGSITGITNLNTTYTDIGSSSSKTKLINGTPIYQSTVPLAFKQTIIPIDTASTLYHTVLVLSYSSDV
jgi:hypothetical protein